MMPVADFVLVVGLAGVAWLSGYVAGLPFAYLRRLQGAA